MSVDENEKWLLDQCMQQPWVHSVSKDQYGRYVVYVKYMDSGVVVPDFTPDGKQVMCHFAVSATATANQFMNMPQTHILKTTEAKLYNTDTVVSAVVVSDPTMDEVVGPEDEEKSLRHLTNELDKLEKQCGSLTLQDIFYEIHDGPNAVTNMSGRYPDVRRGLSKLYQQYGFNVIYEELDG